MLCAGTSFREHEPSNKFCSFLINALTLRRHFHLRSVSSGDLFSVQVYRRWRTKPYLFLCLKTRYWKLKFINFMVNSAAWSMWIVLAMLQSLNHSFWEEELVHFVVSALHCLSWPRTSCSSNHLESNHLESVDSVLMHAGQRSISELDMKRGSEPANAILAPLSLYSPSMAMRVETGPQKKK